MRNHNQLEFQFNTKYTQEGTLEEICEISNLTKAFEHVKRNKGAPGVDGITIEEFQINALENIKKIREEVLNWTYKPAPVRRVEIPKPDGKGMRLLGIPNVRERVLHMAIKMVLDPIVDSTFSPNSYGFRPGRNQKQAVEAAREIVNEGNEYTVDIDLSKFFDRINHDRLIHRLKLYTKDTRVLRLIGMILRSGIMSEGVIEIPTEGSVQGSPLSPLLSNIVLDELDKEIERRNLKFCRFADDCNIFVKSSRAAERVMKSIKNFIEKKLKLKVNEEKSKTAKADQVKFLGMTIVNGAIAISKKALNKAMETIKNLIPRGTNISAEQSMTIINKWYTGWFQYYKMTQYPSQLAALEAHIRRRLRARFIVQQKKRRHLCKKLIKLGVGKALAKKTVHSKHNTWKLSHTRALEQAFSNKWFISRMKQQIYSNLRLPEWFMIEKWVKLS